jgi:hypothetical protein
LQPRLQIKYARAVDREARAKFQIEFEAVKEVRDKTAEGFWETYPRVVAELLQIILDMRAVDQHCARVNAMAAALDGEHRRLKKTELVARDLESFTQERPSLLDGDRGLRLLDFDSGRVTWPPRPQAIDPAAVALHGAVGGDPDRFSADWWRAAERDRQRADQAVAQHEAAQQKDTVAKQDEYHDQVRRAALP